MFGWLVFSGCYYCLREGTLERSTGEDNHVRVWCYVCMSGVCTHEQGMHLHEILSVCVCVCVYTPVSVYSTSVSV